MLFRESQKNIGKYKKFFFGKKDNFHNQFTKQNFHFRESPKVLRKAPTRRLRLWAYLICECAGNISIIHAGLCLFRQGDDQYQ